MHTGHCTGQNSQRVCSKPATPLCFSLSPTPVSHAIVSFAYGITLLTQYPHSPNTIHSSTAAIWLHAIDNDFAADQSLVLMQEERNAQELLDDEDKPDFTPQAFDSLRQVPMYSSFIKERFERCLDLYLCPRSKKKRINVDPQSLVPKLPKPQDLQPFPTTLLLRYIGHTARVGTLQTAS